MKKLRLLLIVGCANDIFIYNMAKWLKAKMNVSIDVFEFYPSDKQGYGSEYYDDVISLNISSWFLKIKGLRTVLFPFLANRELNKWIKTKHYDIIHCHWIVPALVISNVLYKYCNSLCVTFWGGELDKQVICYSHKLYLCFLKRFLKRISIVINSNVFSNKLLVKYPFLEGKTREGHLGSAPLEELYNLMLKESKEESKQLLGIDITKKVVLIGYSGKSLHQHLDIITELSKYDDYKTKIHLLAPMTRGGSDVYVSQVKDALDASGFSYTLLSGCFLSDIEVARLRNVTDIALQLSLFDGFSRSIVECLCAKSVLVYGNWLDYEASLKDNGFSAISATSVSEGISKCCYVVDHFSDYNLMVENNHMSGRGKNIWSECINDWVSVYKEVL